MIEEVWNSLGTMYSHADVGERMAGIPEKVRGGTKSFVFIIHGQSFLVEPTGYSANDYENTVVVIEATDKKCACDCNTQLWKLID